MNKFIAILLMLSSATLHADVFDASSCSGPLMSSRRALELLGEKFEYNLAAGESGRILSGQARVRQHIGSEDGAWYGVLNPVDVLAFLVNDNGQLGLRISLRNGNFADWYTWSCEPDGSSFACTPNDKINGPSLGNRRAIATLTDHCFRLYSETDTKSADYQWAYLVNF